MLVTSSSFANGTNGIFVHTLWN